MGIPLPSIVIMLRYAVLCWNQTQLVYFFRVWFCHWQIKMVPKKKKENRFKWYHYIMCTRVLLSPPGLTFSWWGCYGLCHRHKPTELAHSFDSVLVSVSVLMALSTVFHSIYILPTNFRFLILVLPVLFLPYWSFQLYISPYESLPQLWYNPLWLTGLKAPTN